MRGRQRCIAVIDPVGQVLEAVSASATGALVVTLSEPGRLLAAPEQVGNAVDLLVFATYGPLDWKAVRCALDRWNTMVVATRYEESEALKALSIGLVGYVDGSEPTGLLRRSIRRTLAGHLGFQREVLAAWLRDNGEAAGAFSVLTPRQRAVMALAARGLSDDQIARTLALRPATVRGHLRRAIEQLERRGDGAGWAPPSPPPRVPRGLPLAARWAAAITLAGALSAAFAGPVSAGSLPSEPLYPVKMAGEAVEIVLAFAPQDRTAVELSIASRRLDEARQLAERGSSQLALETTGRYVEHLATAAASAVTAERDHVASTPTVTRLSEQLAQKQVEVEATATALQADPATRGAGGVLAAVTVAAPPQTGQSLALRLAENATAAANNLAEGTKATAPDVSRQARRAETVAHAAADAVAPPGSVASAEVAVAAASDPADDPTAPPALATAPDRPGGGIRRSPPASSRKPQGTAATTRAAEPTRAVGAAAAAPTVTPPSVASPLKAAPPPSTAPPGQASAPAAGATSLPTPTIAPTPTTVQTPTPSPSPSPSPSAVPGRSPVPSQTPPPPTATPAPTATIDPSTTAPPPPLTTPILRKSP